MLMHSDASVAGSVLYAHAARLETWARALGGATLPWVASIASRVTPVQFENDQMRSRRRRSRWAGGASCTVMGPEGWLSMLGLFAASSAVTV